MNPLTFAPPSLPLLLWETPPGLELALAQEGVPFRSVREPDPASLQLGRFLLFDGRRYTRAALAACLHGSHVLIDVDEFRRGVALDPFEALVDNRPAVARWDVGDYRLTERLARRDKGAVRRSLMARLRAEVLKAGGVWVRLSAFPSPYRSAFNFRADLDEPRADDYARFALARRPLDDCSTHFVSTNAYGRLPGVLNDLRGVDTQSHGHYHVTYRDPEANRRNLARAHEVLVGAGFDPVGFAAPHGRWNPGLDAALEGLGYRYSSDFQVGYDDLPFHPWLGGRFSRVLQVPIHPVCEGLFFDAGPEDGRAVADHLEAVVRRKIEAREPAFVYGHPERRLARHPEILSTLARAVENEPLLWRVTLTEFAAWWRFRLSRRWSLVPRGGARYEVQFDDWSPGFPLALDVCRESHAATVPLVGPRTMLDLHELAYERRNDLAEGDGFPRPRPASDDWSVRGVVRRALDWETVTPVDELPARSIRDRFKKRLRRLKATGGRT